MLWALLLAACTGPRQKPSHGYAPLILISIDGFRWDYLQKHAAPTLRRLAAGGVHATRLTPSFPSKTFPNHYIKINAFDSTRGRESLRLSFIVGRPADEPGFSLVREEGPGRSVRYTTRSYATERPEGARY